MSTEAQDTVGHVDNLDADAACIKCSTVNPEGTLICKSCGNNLRDQRSMRMVADQMMDGTTGVPQSKRQRLRIALTTFGILLILYVVLNLSSIEDFLVRSQLQTVDNIQALWTGSDSEIYAGMLSDLLDRPSPQQLSDAINSPVSTGSVEGSYVLVSRGRNLGLAKVLQRDSFIYFVASLTSGEELRGKAISGSQYIRVNWESAGYRSVNIYSAVAGIAQVKPDGTVEVLGQMESVSEDSLEASYTVVGYPIPVS